MIINCEKSTLLNSLNISIKAIPGKSTVDILSCIAIDASGDTVKLTSNNLEMGIETSFNCQIEEPGKCCVEAKQFMEYIKKLPLENVEITVKQKNNFQSSEDVDDIDNKDIVSYVMNIKSGKANYNIPVKSTEEFTFLPAVEKKDPITISQFALKKIINQTEFSISDNPKYKFINGECFEIKENYLRAISTDSSRISIRRIDLGNVYPGRKVIISGKDIRDVSRILSDDNDKFVNIYFTDKYAIFEFDQTIILSRLIDGEYYDVDKMLKSEYDTMVKVNNNELLSSIDRCMPLVRESDNRPIIFQIKDGSIDIRLNSSRGNFNESIEVEKQGKDLIIGFNPRYFIEALKSIDDEEIKMTFTNSKSAVYIRDDDNTYLYFILPLNF
ncbi:MAG: DNA polymerase III subunit beta [Lachnospiraceae bacterium]|jgi:DNA polymerase-3 subunit beta|nr:DNA polymerase III subunit beta [Lachnospiraceae bacterium]MEE3461761.1 DNA polymerase III subunit beta [Lachnospiraceae bacterium]